MPYIFRQKFNTGDLAALDSIKRRVLIYEPDPYLGALYTHYLRSHNFDVKHCPYLPFLKKAIEDFLPQLLIFSAEQSSDSLKAPVFSINFKKDFPNLLLITVGYNLDSENLKKLMERGACGHVNRKLSKPQDVVEIVKSLLFL